jgi:predicted NAD/FAD-binding protein
VKIAVVGAGISGLTAAYLLNRAHDVELFERNAYAGGHANTVVVSDSGAKVALDTGFIVYNEDNYPGFTRLLRELNVSTQASEMSLGVSCQSCRLEYSSRGLRGMLAQRTNIARPPRWMLGVDILRFYRDTRRVLRRGPFQTDTLGEYLRARRYSGEFSRHFLVPLAAAVWSTSPRQALDFPLRHFLQFLTNHGIIGLQPANKWRTVAGGSRNYIRAMLDTFPGQTHLAAPPTRIERRPDSVHVQLASGECRSFDQVVLACHADEALALLVDPSEAERRALGAFSYTSNRVVLHSDVSLLPARPAARGSWNYATRDCRSDSALAMTYHLNRLQALSGTRDYCVSVNPRHIHPGKIIQEMTYDHPQYTFETLEAQQVMERINGERRTWYAGAHLGYGFHEDGLASGARVAAAFGIAL